MSKNINNEKQKCHGNMCILSFSMVEFEIYKYNEDVLYFLSAKIQTSFEVLGGTTPLPRS